MPAARAEDGREPAREGLEQRVRARVVPARRQVDVAPPQLGRKRFRRDRSEDANVLERLVRATRERQLVAIVVEMPVEPGDDVGALVRVVGPARRDDPYAPSGERLALGRRMEDRRVDRVRDHGGSTSSIPSARCASRLYRDCTIVASASSWLISAIRASVPSSKPRYVADRAVDAMDEAHVVPREAAQPAEVEVEGVEEAGSCPRRDPVHLDRETASLELAYERPQELVPTARRRRRELVEEREIRRSSPREADAVDLGRQTSRATAPAPRRARAITPRPVMPRAVAPSAASTSN